MVCNQLEFKFHLYLAHVSWGMTLSFHCLNLFNLPLGHIPSILILATTLMFSVSYHLFTCPNHSNLLITIDSTLATSKISYLPCSSQYTPNGHCPSHILISVVAFHLSLSVSQPESTKLVEPLSCRTGPSYSLELSCHKLSVCSQISTMPTPLRSPNIFFCLYF